MEEQFVQEPSPEEDEPIESQPMPEPTSPATPDAVRPEPLPARDAATLASTPMPMEDAFSEIEGEKEPTKFQLFLRKALTWLGIGAVVFLAGFLTFYFTLYQPKVDALNQSETAIIEANDNIRSLEADLSNANSQLEALSEADNHRALLSVMADIYAARLALSQENTVAAKAALKDTDTTLEEIIGVIGDFDSRLANTLPQRLSLIVSNIDGDMETAIQDCDQMIRDLQQVEETLYP